MQQRTIDAGRLALAVTEVPAAQRPPLVLLHGIGSRSTTWWPVLDRLAERFHLYALDLRGHGASAKPARGYLVDDYAADLAAALDALALDRPVVLGHSLGALTALRWAAAHPARAAAVVVEDPPLRTEPATLTAFDGWQALAALPVAEAAAYYKREHPDWTDEECRRRAESITGTAPAVFAELRADAEAALNGRPADWIPTMAAISAPTLVLVGEPGLGSMTRPEDAARLAATVPRARLVAVPGAGHSPHRERPERFLAALAAFLDGVGESRRREDVKT